MRSLIFLSILLFCNFSIDLHAQSRIATVDRDFVYMHMPETPKLQELMASKRQALNQEITEKETEMKEAYQQIITSAQPAPEELAQFQAHHDSLLQYFQQADAALTQLEANIQRTILQELMEAINYIAREEGYTHVFNQSPQGLSEVMFAPDRDNITPLVLLRLEIDATYPPKPEKASTE